MRRLGRKTRDSVYAFLSAGNIPAGLFTLILLLSAVILMLSRGLHLLETTLNEQRKSHQSTKSQPESGYVLLPAPKESAKERLTPQSAIR